MNRLYSVSVMKEDRSTTFIKEGFLKCNVSELVHPFRKRLFFFCLHCCKLRSASWFYSHRKTEDCSPSSQWLEYVFSHFDHFVNHIVSKVDNLDAIGNLFKEAESDGLTHSIDNLDVDRGDEMVGGGRAISSEFPAEFGRMDKVLF